MTKKTPDYREILRLHSETEYSQQEIADSVGSSKMNTDESTRSHLARTTFCWFPPLRKRTS